VTTIPIGPKDYPARATRVWPRNSATASAAACGDPAHLSRLLGGADPESDRDRHLGLGLGRGDQVGEILGQRIPLPGGPHRRDDVDEAAGDGADPAQAPRRRRRRDQRHQGQPGRTERLADLLPLAQRQVWDDRPGGARLDGASREGLGAAVREDHVGVDHEDDGEPVRDGLADLQGRFDVGPALEGGGRGGVDRRPVRQRVRKGDAELDQIGTGVGIGGGDGKRGVVVREATHHVGHQCRAAFVLRSLESATDPLLSAGPVSDQLFAG
jgi:hypothetical protein